MIAVAGNQWITRYLVTQMAGTDMPPDLLINLGREHADGISGYDDLGDLGIEIYRPTSYTLEDDQDRRGLLSRPIDVLLVFGWQRLIPTWLLEHARRGAYGVHGGPEPPPRCRGQAVFNWAILLGYDRFYMYLFRLTPKADDGQIVELRLFDILPEDDIRSVYNKNCVTSSQMFIRHLPAISEGTVELRDQPSGQPTVAPRRRPEHGGIDWTQGAARIANLVRAVASPYPGAFADIAGERVTIDRAHVFDTQIDFEHQPGTVVAVFPDGHFVVATGKHALYVREWRAPDPALIEVGGQFALRSGEQPPEPAL